jgi:hypothetical protein
MRIKIYKGDEQQQIKADRLDRFLERGWQVSEPALPKKSTKPKVKVEASADVVEEPSKQEQVEPDWEDPFISMPTEEPKGE